jgi:septal ring factor EnvC (AmiA/AmiB activator)
MESITKKLSDLLCNRTVRKALFLFSLIVSIFCLVAIFSIAPKEDKNLQKQIDDLEKRSQELLKAQAKYDSTIQSQEQYVHELESKITNIKEKTTIIKEYYTRIQEKVNDYDHNQIDSFFRQKYNY